MLQVCFHRAEGDWSWNKFHAMWKGRGSERMGSGRVVTVFLETHSRAMLGTELCQTDDRLNKYAARLEKKDSREVGGSTGGGEGGRQKAAVSKNGGRILSNP